MPGGDRDCRPPWWSRPTGWFEVELRDNTYGGDDRARYRLRVDPDPFATGMFPLGVPAVGAPRPGPQRGLDAGTRPGSGQPDRDRRRLARPRPVRGSLESAARFESARAHDAGATILPPGRVRVGDTEWPEVTEPADQPPEQPWPVPGGSTGVTINGRLDRAGQVDRFRVDARAGDRFRARVEAAAAGSWLDSVLTVLGPTGEALGRTTTASPDRCSNHRQRSTARRRPTPRWTS